VDRSVVNLYVGNLKFRDQVRSRNAGRIVAHIQHSGDDARADLLEVALGDPGIDTISEDAVEVVNNDTAP
jgi:hypothetical protein